MYRSLLKVCMVAASAILLTTATAWADDDEDDDDLSFSEELQQDVRLRAVRRHQQALQDIADQNDGTRAAGTPGYTASVDYIERRLRRAGYDVVRQPFQFPFFSELSDPELELIVGGMTTIYAPNDTETYNTMTYSGSGDATASYELIDPVLPPAPAANTSTSGCEAADFAGFTAGNIALIQRGSCSFQLKAVNAENAGAVGVIIFNEGQPGRTAAINGTLGAPVSNIPVVGASFALGEELIAANGPGAQIRLAASTISEIRDAENVLADTRDGNPDQTIVVGAHLDSVGAGAGINDNGSGSAAILEVALQLGPGGDDDDDDDEMRLQNRVRFAWWGAEELGLLGSAFYVADLSAEEQAQIAMNLNFDMVGSPNFVRFVYDGDGSDTTPAGPPGSGDIESVFVDYFASRGLASAPTQFSGRSDYGPFIAVGIPAGGLFTGAEGVKTVAEAEIYGGSAEVAYDPCYHLACDTIVNNSDEVLDQNADAIAHTVATYAQRAELFPAPVALATFAAARSLSVSSSYKWSLSDFEYLGERQQR